MYTTVKLRLSAPLEKSPLPLYIENHRLHRPKTKNYITEHEKKINNKQPGA